MNLYSMVVDGGPRHVAPKIDDRTEIRCPAKGGGVIAAERCLQAQARGCTCARQALPATVEEARSGGKEISPQRQLGSSGVSSIDKTQRALLSRKVLADLAASVPRSAIAERLGLTLCQVEALGVWGRRRARRGGWPA